MRNWTPTHLITGPNLNKRVMLCLEADGSGPAYTREEWDSADTADYSRQSDGSWLFQGEAFTGSVRSL